MNRKSAVFCLFVALLSAHAAHAAGPVEPEGGAVRVRPVEEKTLSGALEQDGKGLLNEIRFGREALIEVPVMKTESQRVMSAVPSEGLELEPLTKNVRRWEQFKIEVADLDGGVQSINADFETIPRENRGPRINRGPVVMPQIYKVELKFKGARGRILDRFTLNFEKTYLNGESGRRFVVFSASVMNGGVPGLLRVKIQASSLDRLSFRRSIEKTILSFAPDTN